MLGLKLSGLCEEGIWLGRFKGSLSQLVQWSPRLEQATEKALAAREEKFNDSFYLFPNKDGNMITRFGRASILRRIKQKALDAGSIDDSNEFQLKDLKAKGISDADNLMLETGELNL